MDEAVRHPARWVLLLGGFAAGFLLLLLVLGAQDAHAEETKLALPSVPEGLTQLSSLGSQAAVAAPPSLAPSLTVEPAAPQSLGVPVSPVLAAVPEVPSVPTPNAAPYVDAATLLPELQAPGDTGDLIPDVLSVLESSLNRVNDWAHPGVNGTPASTPRADLATFLLADAWSGTPVSVPRADLATFRLADANLEVLAASTASPGLATAGAVVEPADLGGRPVAPPGRSPPDPASSGSLSSTRDHRVDTELAVMSVGLVLGCLVASGVLCSRPVPPSWVPSATARPG